MLYGFTCSLTLFFNEIPLIELFEMRNPPPVHENVFYARSPAEWKGIREAVPEIRYAFAELGATLLSSEFEEAIPQVGIVGNFLLLHGIQAAILLKFANDQLYIRGFLYVINSSWHVAR